MYTVNKQITIYWTKNSSAFLKANPDLAIEEGTRTIGSSRSAVKTMLANGEEQRAIMPTVLGIDPNSQTSNWDKELKNYWDSISQTIPPEGKKLNISFSYDFKTQDDLRHKAIKDLKADEKDIKDDKSLAEFVEENVEEQYKYKYGKPVDAADYMLWRYCLVYGFIANTLKDVDKSPKKIKFYLYSEEEKKKERKEKSAVKLKVTEYYVKVAKDKKLLDAILTVTGTENVDSLDPDDKLQALDLYTVEHPKTFINLVEDKHIETKADIEKLITANQLRRLPHTTRIVDAEDFEKPIGDNIDDAVAFFLNDKNKAIVGEYMSVYKHNKKK